MVFYSWKTNDYVIQDRARPDKKCLLNFSSKFSESQFVWQSFIKLTKSIIFIINMFSLLGVRLSSIGSWPGPVLAVTQLFQMNSLELAAKYLFSFMAYLLQQKTWFDNWPFQISRDIWN